MRRIVRTTLFLFLAIPSVAASQALDAPVRYDTDHLSAEFHRGRRAALVERLPEDALAIFFSNPVRNRTGDQDYEYRQQADLLYLTGSEEIGTVLLLAPAAIDVDDRSVKEVLFVPPRDPAHEVWEGRRFGVDEAMAELGVELALETGRYAEIVVPLLQDRQHTVYHLPIADGVPQGGDLIEQLGSFVQNVDRTEASDGGKRDGTTLRGLLDNMRAIKEPEEMAVLQRAIDITIEAHREVMQQVEPGWAEYEIEALIEYTFKKMGAEQPGFASIVGSGENSIILHYNTNRRVTEPGDVVVIDVGAEYRGYSADLTRTLPLNGSFSPEQRAIYQIVYDAENAGIEAARAGASFGATNAAAMRVIADGLAELGLIDGPDDRAGVRRFFMHGTSHYIGLDVHDAGPYDTLRPGTTITIEPGIYIAPADDIDPKWWNIGVRIEDDVLVTEGDPVILSADLPRHVDEVEALMQGRPIS